MNTTKAYKFHAPKLLASASLKFTAKMCYPLSKIAAFDEETTLRHTLLHSDLQCLPLAIPEYFVRNIGVPLLATHSLFAWRYWRRFAAFSKYMT